MGNQSRIEDDYILAEVTLVATTVNQKKVKHVIANLFKQ